MREIKTVLVPVCLILLVTASFGINRIYPEEKVGQHSEIKVQSPCENEHIDDCLNGGEGYYLINEDIVGCLCRWLYGGNRCEKYKCVRL